MKRFLVLLCIFYIALACDDKGPKEVIVEQSAKEDSPVSEYQLDVYNFNEFESFLTKKDDKIYVVNFWATWCAPCIKELPYFEELNSAYKDKDVEVLLVSLDFPRQYEKKLIPFIENKKLKSKVIALDDPKMNDWIPKVDEDWSGAIPATIIYNKEKSEFYERSFNFEELEAELKQFITP